MEVDTPFETLTGKKILVYLRVSTEKQSEEDMHGLDSQRKTCIDWLNANGLKATKIIQEIGSAKCGKGQTRLIDFLDEVISEDNKPWIIVVFAVDRLFRDIDLMNSFADVLQENDAIIVEAHCDKVYKLSEPTEFDAFEHKVQVAQKELEMIAARVKSGLAYRKSCGKDLGKAPYGFYRNHETGKNEEDGEEYQVLQLISYVVNYQPDICELESHLDEDLTEFQGMSWNFATVAALLNHLGYEYRGTTFSAANVRNLFNWTQNH